MGCRKAFAATLLEKSSSKSVVVRISAACRPLVAPRRLQWRLLKCKAERFLSRRIAANSIVIALSELGKDTSHKHKELCQTSTPLNSDAGSDLLHMVTVSLHARHGRASSRARSVDPNSYVYHGLSMFYQVGRVVVTDCY